jgi:hypothetical protein
MHDITSKKHPGITASPLRLQSPSVLLSQSGNLYSRNPFSPLPSRYLISSDIKILRPKVNTFALSMKSNTQRDYIKKSKFRIRAKISQTVRNPSQYNSRSRLVVVGSKEKIESPNQVRRNLNTPAISNYKNQSSRPCTCSPNKHQRQSRETLTIKIPIHPAEGDSDRDSNYCNYYLENQHIFNY